MKNARNAATAMTGAAVADLETVALRVAVVHAQQAARRGVMAPEVRHAEIGAQVAAAVTASSEVVHGDSVIAIVVIVAAAGTTQLRNVSGSRSRRTFR